MAHELLSQSRKRNERGGGLHKSGRRLHMYVTNVSVSSAVNMLKNPVDIRRPFNVDIHCVSTGKDDIISIFLLTCCVLFTEHNF